MDGRWPVWGKALGMTITHQPLFDYEFTIWPEEHAAESAVFEVFRDLTPRTSMTMTDELFRQVLRMLSESGLTAMDVEKTVHDDVASTGESSPAGDRGIAFRSSRRTSGRSPDCRRR